MQRNYSKFEWDKKISRGGTNSVTTMMFETEKIKDNAQKMLLNTTLGIAKSYKEKHQKIMRRSRRRRYDVFDNKWTLNTNDINICFDAFTFDVYERFSLFHLVFSRQIIRLFHANLTIPALDLFMRFIFLLFFFDRRHFIIVYFVVCVVNLYPFKCRWMFITYLEIVKERTNGIILLVWMPQILSKTARPLPPK